MNHPSKRHVPPPKAWCSRCGHSERKRIFEIARRGNRDRCSRCGGNLVRYRELPADVARNIDRRPTTRKGSRP